MVALAPALAEESPSACPVEIPAYLQPIWQAAQQPIVARPEAQRNLLELERSELALSAEDAEWRPTIYSDNRGNLSEQVSNNSTESGSSDTIVRNTTATTELGINQALSTGTDVSLSASTSRETNNRRNSFLQESWVSRVRLSISQDLLRGSNREANLRAIRDAESEIEASRETIDQELISTFADLSAAWLDYGRAELAKNYSLQALRDSEENLELSQARFDSGLSSRSEILRPLPGRRRTGGRGQTTQP